MLNEKVYNLPNKIPTTKKELAESYGITQQTMNNYMRMADMIIELENLIETNIRQRGIGNTNQRKMGLCIKELDRIYGIREGSAGKVSKNLEGNNFIPKNEEELLKSLGLGVDKRTIQNYKKLTEMIPELEELVDTGIATPTTAFAYETKEEVMEWMLDIQLGRRNLSPIQRIAIAEKYRSIYEKQARENLKFASGGDRRSEDFKKNQGLKNSSKVENKIDVRAKLAETAGVSTDTYSKGKKILDSDNEEVKEKVLSGEMSINAGYNKIKKHW